MVSVLFACFSRGPILGQPVIFVKHVDCRILPQTHWIGRSGETCQGPRRKYSQKKTTSTFCFSHALMQMVSLKITSTVDVNALKYYLKPLSWPLGNMYCYYPSDTFVCGKFITCIFRFFCTCQFFYAAEETWAYASSSTLDKSRYLWIWSYLHTA